MGSSGRPVRRRCGQLTAGSAPELQWPCAARLRPGTRSAWPRLHCRSAPRYTTAGRGRQSSSAADSSLTTDGRDRACIPHTKLLSRFFPRSRDSSAYGLLDGNNTLKRLFPGGNAVTKLVLIQAVEGVFVQAEPRAVRIVGLHHFAPDLYRKPEARFFVP